MRLLRTVNPFMYKEMNPPVRDARGALVNKWAAWFFCAELQADGAFE